MRHRDWTEIWADVLAAISGGEKRPTRIMYASNTSWTPLMVILKSMIAEGLITFDNKGRYRKVYQITEAGREWLRIYRRLLPRSLP